MNTELDQNDRNALITLENYGGYNNRFFSGGFSASRIFSGGFSVSTENIQLFGEIR